MINNFVIFFLSGILSFILEHQIKSGCKESFLTLSISLLHNYVSIYLVFGSVLFGYHFIHLLSLCIVVILWNFDKMCILTTYYNNLCGISSTRPFHDVFFLINQKLKIPHLRYLLASIVALYDIKNSSNTIIL